MKIRVFIVMLAMCFCMSTQTFAGDKVRITNGEWPPYMSENLKHYGLASHIVTQAFAAEGVTVEYGFFPWKRSFVLAKDGKWDGSAVWSKTADREPHFVFSEPVIQDMTVFFHRKDVSFDWKSWDDLKGLKIGGTMEYNYGPEFKAAEKAGTFKVEYVANDETNFKKLLGGRIQIFVCNIEVGYSILNKMYDKATVNLVTNHPKAVKKDTLGLILSKKYPKHAEMMAKFNSGLAKLRAEGNLDQWLEESRRGDYKK